MYLRNIQARTCVSHDRVTHVDQARVDCLQMRDYFTQFSKEALGANITVDNVGVVVDIVSIEPIYQLL